MHPGDFSESEMTQDLFRILNKRAEARMGELVNKETAEEWLRIIKLFNIALVREKHINLGEVRLSGYDWTSIGLNNELVVV